MAFMGGAQYQIACLLEALQRQGNYQIYYAARRVRQIPVR